MITEQDAATIVESLNSSFRSTGIRIFNEDSKCWSLTPLSEIEFVSAPVDFIKS